MTNVTTRRAADCVIVVAASTGGPGALARVLPALPPSLGAAVLVVQHMPAGFTASLAARLAARLTVPVREACDGESLEPARVYLARGGAHLVVDDSTGTPRLRLDHGDAVWGVRPAADLLFASAAHTFGERTIGVVLTGMGRDGADGLRRVDERGGWSIVQAPESCVASAMPLAALAAAGADVVAPLDGVAAAIRDAVRALRRAEPVGGRHA